MAHRQGFVPVYIASVNMFILRQVEALQSIEHVDACRIHRETNVTSYHGLRQSYSDDHAHSVA